MTSFLFSKCGCDLGMFQATAINLIYGEKTLFCGILTYSHSDIISL